MPMPLLTDGAACLACWRYGGEVGQRKRRHKRKALKCTPAASNEVPAFSNSRSHVTVAWLVPTRTRARRGSCTTASKSSNGITNSPVRDLHNDGRVEAGNVLRDRGPKE